MVVYECVWCCMVVYCTVVYGVWWCTVVVYGVLYGGVWSVLVYGGVWSVVLIRWFNTLECNGFITY